MSELQSPIARGAHAGIAASDGPILPARRDRASGAWNAGIVGEYLHFRGQRLFTAGRGATISRATVAGNFPLLLAATLALAAVVVSMNGTLWQRLYRLAETRFKLET